MENQEIALVANDSNNNKVAKPIPMLSSILNDETAFLEAIEGVKAIDTKRTFPVNMADNYIVFVMGEEMKLMFMGIDERETPDQKTGETQNLPTAYFLDKKGNLLCNSAFKIVDTIIKKQIAIKTMLSITWVTQRPTKNGNQMRIFDIRPLVD